MKLIYIIAPYRAPTLYEVHRNNQAAEYAAYRLWCAGYAVICAHKNSGYLDGVVPDTVFLDAGLNILRRCDCAVVIGDISNSKGSQSELSIAENKMPVYHGVAEAIDALNNLTRDDK